eukprot:6034448-Pyramimonas_sp.AAC.1
MDSPTTERERQLRRAYLAHLPGALSNLSKGSSPGESKRRDWEPVILEKRVCKREYTECEPIAGGKSAHTRASPEGVPGKPSHLREVGEAIGHER